MSERITLRLTAIAAFASIGLFGMVVAGFSLPLIYKILDVPQEQK